MLAVRLANLALPLPLETAIHRALSQPDRAAQHEGLVVAWELAARILAGSLWAACRQSGARSEALERASAKLSRPTFGHWIELVRACAGALRERDDPTARAFRGTLEGLDAPIPTEGGLRALAERIDLLHGSPLRSKRIHELLGNVAFYRNEAQSTHKQVDPAFREASVAAVLEGLVEFCERVPLCGAHTLVLVGRLERTARGGSVEFARHTGAFPEWSTREVGEATWRTLVSWRPYLFGAHDTAVPLFPMAAAAPSSTEWRIGWFAGQVRLPTVAYQGVGGADFQVALAPEDEKWLAGARASEPREGATAAALALEPYRGLLAYAEEHAPIYFGREEETSAAVARLCERGVLFAYGASGSGKSSWLCAGLLPALRARAELAGRELLPIVMTPTDAPLASLRRALTQALTHGRTTKEALVRTRRLESALALEAGDDDAGLERVLRELAADAVSPVLVVDQLEEAVVLARDPRESRVFLALFARAARTARASGSFVLASARTDRLAPLLEHANVRAILQDDGWPLGSIAGERLTRVVLDPLRGRGVVVDSGLAETIAADLGNEPGALALLSPVLAALWNERARFGGALTKIGYEDAGRVAGALRTQAEAALAEAGAASNDAERRVDRLFQALATPDASGTFTRRRAELAALAAQLGLDVAAVRALAEPFVARRLLVLSADGDRETVEVAHERLFDAWPRLAELLAKRREALELRVEVERSARLWETSGRTHELWNDSMSRLRRSEELVAGGQLDLDASGGAFLAASRASVRRRARLERTVLATTAVLALTATALAIVARAKTVRAEENARENEEGKRVLLEKEQAELQLLPLKVKADLDDLERRADALWPAHPALLPDLEAWITDAESLVQGRAATDAGEIARPSLEDLRRELHAVRSRARPRTSEEIERARRAHPLFETWNTNRASLARGEIERTREGLVSPELDAVLATLRRDVESLDAVIARESVTYELDDPRDALRHVRLAELVARLEAFTDEDRGGLFSRGISQAHGPGVLKRRDDARALAALSVEGSHGDRLWRETIEGMGRNPAYRGLTLTPQAGLLPLGTDRDSGLLEFAHLLTGEPPERRGGELAIRPESSLVLVLVPGGEFVLGAQSSARAREDFDANARADERPPRRIALAPYFLSKYEMTQAQWLRATGANPSRFDRDGYDVRWDGEGQGWSPLHPVERVSWHDCDTTLARLGLELPSEAQWERAARAKTAFPWSSGAERLSLDGAANLADSFASKVLNSLPAGAWEPDIDDRWGVHAPVGRFQPNAFGLHDVHGNVAEWCRNAYTAYGLAYDVEGRLPAEDSQARVHRGGAFDSPASEVRSARRASLTPASTGNMIGVRPARRVE